MEVTVEDISTVKKMLNIEVPEDKVVSELDRAYRELKKTAKVKGFRPGKAPRNVLERLYRKDVNSDVMSKLVQASIMEAIKEKELQILGQPIINPSDFDGKGPFKYEAIVEIKPEIPDLEYEGLKLTKNIFKQGNNEVEIQIEALRKKLAKHEPIKEERPVKDGDFVVIDYEGFKDGKPFDAVPRTEQYRLKIGDGIISDDFDKALIGLKAGDDKNVTVDFTSEYHNKQLAGQTVSYQVAVKQILEEILPDVDDEFAKKVGKFQTLDELKKTIADNLADGYAKRTEQDLHEQVFNSILQKTDFEVPDIMVDYELEGIIADVSRAFMMSNMMPEQIDRLKATFAEKYRGTALEQVRRHLILGKIIEQNRLELSREELEEGYKEISKAQNMTIEEIQKFYQENQDKLELYKHALLEKKALDLIIEKSTIEEVEHESEKSEKKSEDELEDKVEQG